MLMSDIKENIYKNYLYFLLLHLPLHFFITTTPLSVAGYDITTLLYFSQAIVKYIILLTSLHL